jgi:hypothetical protein
MLTEGSRCRASHIPLHRSSAACWMSCVRVIGPGHVGQVVAVGIGGGIAINVSGVGPARLAEEDGGVRLGERELSGSTVSPSRAMEVSVTTGEHFSFRNCPPGPGRVSMTVRRAKTRLQKRVTASLPRRMMWPSSASLAPSVMPRIAFRPARAVRLVVLGWTVTVTDIRLL